MSTEGDEIQCEIVDAFGEIERGSTIGDPWELLRRMLFASVRACEQQHPERATRAPTRQVWQVMPKPKQKDAPAAWFRNHDADQLSGLPEDRGAWVAKCEAESHKAAVGKAGENRFKTITGKSINSEKPVHPAWRK